ncbi:hypothetical protein [Nocardia gipuzkoensis]
MAPDGDRIVVWTNPKTWKVKRIRRNPEVTLQVCDGRGRPASEEVVRASSTRTARSACATRSRTNTASSANSPFAGTS